MKVENVPLLELDRRNLRAERALAQQAFAHVSLRKSVLNKAFNEKVTLFEQQRVAAKLDVDSEAVLRVEQELGRFVARTSVILSALASRVKESKEEIARCTTALKSGEHRLDVVLCLDPWAKRMRLIHPHTYSVIAVRGLSPQEAERANDRQTLLPGIDDDGSSAPWDQVVEEPDQLSRDLLSGMPSCDAVARWNDLYGYEKAASVSPMPAPTPGIQAAVDRFKDAARDIGVGISVRAGGKTTVLVPTPEDKPVATKGKRAKKGAAA